MIKDKENKSKKNKSGKPRFKKKGKCRPSYTTSFTNNNIELIGNKLKVTKVGLIDILLHRELPDWAQKIQSVTIFRCNNATFIPS